MHKALTTLDLDDVPESNERSSNSNITQPNPRYTANTGSHYRYATETTRADPSTTVPPESVQPYSAVSRVSETAHSPPSRRDSEDALSLSLPPPNQLDRGFQASQTESDAYTQDTQESIPMSQRSDYHRGDSFLEPTALDSSDFDGLVPTQPAVEVGSLSVQSSIDSNELIPTQPAVEVGEPVSTYTPNLLSTSPVEAENKLVPPHVKLRYIQQGIMSPSGRYVAQFLQRNIAPVQSIEPSQDGSLFPFTPSERHLSTPSTPTTTVNETLTRAGDALEQWVNERGSADSPRVGRGNPPQSGQALMFDPLPNSEAGTSSSPETEKKASKLVVG